MEQRLMFVEAAVFSRLVKFIISATALFAAGFCAMDFRSFLHNGLSFIRTTGLFCGVHGVTYFGRHQIDCQHCRNTLALLLNY